MKYVVIYNYPRKAYVVGAKPASGYDTPKVTVDETVWKFFDDLKEAAEFRASNGGVLLKNLEYDITEVEEEESK